MGVLMDFLLDNYIYFLFVAVILVLALIGYIVDSTKTAKLKKELTKVDKEETDIPVLNIDSNVKLGDSVNKMAMNGQAVDKSATVKPESPVAPVTPRMDVKK